MPYPETDIIIELGRNIEGQDAFENLPIKHNPHPHSVFDNGTWVRQLISESSPQSLQAPSESKTTS